MASIVTLEEIQKSRPASEVLEWTRTVYARFSATKELRAAAREGKYFAKEMSEEAYPVAIFAHTYFDASPDVFITQVIGNQNYDAQVDDRRGNASNVHFIEATVSDWSYMESLRMELLNKKGSAPAYTEVQAEGPRHHRTKLDGTSEAVDHDVIREQHIAGVVAAVARKSKKNYPEGTALVVRIDDATPFRDDQDIAVLQATAIEQLIPMLTGREFRVLSLAGLLGTCLCYELS